MELQDHAAELEAKGVRIFAVSVDPVDKAAEMKQRCRAGSITFISDPEGRTIDAFGIRHKGASPTGGDAAYSTSALIGRDGKVRWIRRSDTFRVRPSPQELLAEAAKLSEPPVKP